MSQSSTNRKELLFKGQELGFPLTLRDLVRLEVERSEGKIGSVIILMIFIQKKKRFMFSWTRGFFCWKQWSFFVEKPNHWNRSPVFKEGWMNFKCLPIGHQHHQQETIKKEVQSSPNLSGPMWGMIRMTSQKKELWPVVTNHIQLLWMAVNDNGPHINSVKLWEHFLAFSVVNPIAYVSFTSSRFLSMSPMTFHHQDPPRPIVERHPLKAFARHVARDLLLEPLEAMCHWGHRHGCSKHQRLGKWIARRASKKIHI